MTFAEALMPTHRPWDWPLASPLTIAVQARPFDWADAWLMPSEPVAAAETTGPIRQLTLIPYGNTEVLRISMFPYLA
jgi:hypothetical protein